MDTNVKIIIIVAAVFVLLLAIVLSSRSRIKRVYKKYLTVGNKHDLTGSQFASVAIRSLKLDEVKLGVTDGELVDAYSPKSKMLIMSRAVCNTASLASITIVAHELGHACQHKNNSPLFFTCILFGKLSRFLNHFVLPLILAGIVLLIVQAPVLTTGLIVLYVALGIFLFNLLTKILNIPLEYNASHRALKFLKENDFVTSSDYGKAKKLLRIAAQTYIASLFDGIIIFGNKLSNLFYRRHPKK